MVSLSPFIRTSLAAGQSLHLHVDAGTAIFVTQGSISVAEALLWSGDQFLPHSTILREGDFYVVQISGWMTVDVHETVEIVCQRADSSLLARFLAQLFRPGGSPPGREIANRHRRR